MVTVLDGPFNDAGILTLVDLVMIDEIDKPFKHDDSGLYIHTYSATRHVPEPMEDQDECLYVLDFMHASRKQPEIPEVDKRFWAVCRMQGSEEEDGSIRMSLLVTAWDYNLEDIKFKHTTEVKHAIITLAASTLQVVLPGNEPVKKQTNRSESEPEEEPVDEKPKTKKKKGKADDKRSHSLPPLKTEFKPYEEGDIDDDQVEQEQEPEEDPEPEINEEDEGLPEKPDDDIPFDSEDGDDEKEELDDSWANELEGE